VQCKRLMGRGRIRGWTIEGGKAAPAALAKDGRKRVESGNVARSRQVLRSKTSTAAGGDRGGPPNLNKS